MINLVFKVTHFSYVQGDNKKKDVVANLTLELDREEIKNRDMFNDIRN